MALSKIKPSVIDPNPLPNGSLTRISTTYHVTPIPDGAHCCSEIMQSESSPPYPSWRLIVPGCVKDDLTHHYFSLILSLSLCLSLGLSIYLSSWCISHRHTHPSTLISNVTPLHPHNSLCAPIETPSKTTHAAVFCNHFVHMLWIIALGYLGSRVSHLSSVMLFVCYFCPCNFSGIFFFF